MDRSFESSGTSTVNKKHVDPTMENSGVSERTVPQCDSPWKWRCNKKRVEPSDPRREADAIPDGNHDNDMMNDLNRGRVLGQSHCTIKSYPLSTPLVTQRCDQISIGEYYGYGSLVFEDRSPPISPEHGAKQPTPPNEIRTTEYPYMNKKNSGSSPNAVLSRRSTPPNPVMLNGPIISYASIANVKDP